MIKVGVSGASGKMGKAVALALQAQAELFNVSALFSRSEGSCSVAGLCAANLVFDFSSPAATRLILAEAPKHKCALLIGTTGLTEEDFALIKTVSLTNPVLYAANTSYGVLVLCKLTKLLAELLPADYDIRLIEQHHIHKKDAPSGTALQLARIIDTNSLAGTKCNIASLRAGGILGAHEIVAANAHEVLSISHSLISRDALAYGAVRAGLWLSKQPTGFYSMDDVV